MADSEARKNVRDMKIVNIDELKIDRQSTINIYVERNGSSDLRGSNSGNNKKGVGGKDQDGTTEK